MCSTASCLCLANKSSQERKVIQVNLMDPEMENSSEPKKKKPGLSLSLKKRFGESVASSLPELTTPTVPSNMKKNTCWAIKNFRD